MLSVYAIFFPIEIARAGKIGEARPAEHVFDGEYAKKRRFILLGIAPSGSLAVASSTGPRARAQFEPGNHIDGLEMMRMMPIKAGGRCPRTNSSRRWRRASSN